MRAIVLPLALSACATAPMPITATKAALSVEIAYQAAGEAILAAEAAGVVPDTAKPCIKALDNRAYAAVKVVRTGYDHDLKQARSAIADLLARKGC